MLSFLETLLYAALVLMVLALIIDLVVVTSQNRAPRRRVAAAPAKAAAPEVASAVEPQATARAGASTVATAVVERTVDELAELDDEAEEPVRRPAVPAAKPAVPRAPLNIGTLSTGFTVVACVLLTGYIIGRTIVTGRSPLTNMHEYGVAFVWAIVLASLVAFWRFRVRVLSVVALAVGAIMLAYALSVGNDVQPLVPALQNSSLLTLHVGFAILGSGAACVSFAGAALYLAYPKLHLKIARDQFDDMGYKAAIVSYPPWTLMLLFGALWANVAWGKYWSWDPKETAALVTWLIYTAFLHARVVRGWRGTRSSWLLVIAFVAVLFTLFGNYFFGGLHSYAS
ncbi:MAG: cytochrome c biogenesis protein CcsA [Actinomycetia bacterium]|nr:cytochrome c biogenesis protein CcsA [Actinomycetes bacterium]